MDRGHKARVIVPAVLTLAACGGQPRTAPPAASPAATAAPAPAASIDACSLLTRQEVEAALGKAVGEGTPETTPPVFGCRWAVPASFDGASITVVIYDSPAQALAAFETALKINNYDQVAGVGDRAYTGLIFDITVLKGRHELAVDVTVSAGDEKAAARRLAEQAVARLPG